MRSFSDNPENFEANAEAWRAASAPSAYRPPAAEAAAATARDTEDMLAHVSRSESETQNAYRRIEDQLRAVARRLETTERSQSENNRAMTKAATEINIASREQAQAFDQLSGHIVALSERLTRVEQHTTNDGVREAIKALHLGLSRLADQMSSTATQSTTQIASLVDNVEALANKLSQVRLEADNSSHMMGGRLATVETRLRHVEQNEGQSAALTQVSDTLDRLTARFSASDAQNQGTIARLEEQLARLEARAQDPASDRRLQTIEHALSDVAARLDNAERRNSGTAGLEDNLAVLAARLEAAEKRQRDSAAELQAAIKEATARPEPVHQPAPQVAAPQMAPSAAAPISFDLPPFPDHQPQQPAFQQPEPLSPPPFENGFGGEPAFAAPPPFTGEALEPEQPDSNESYLAAARRAARTAAAAETADTARPGFSWGIMRDSGEPVKKRTSTRWALIGGIALIAVGAMLAGVLLSRSQHTVTTPRNVATMFAKPQTAPVKPSIVSTAPAATTPGSPVVVPPKTMARIDVKPAPVKPVQTALAKPAPTQTAAVTPADRVTTLANSGNAKAQLLMGLRYLDGTGAPVNEAEAARWFERAAKQGEPISEYRLGTLYERGRGVPADAKKAAQWYAAAANAGNRKAMHNLAVAFAQGSGVAKDYTQAAQWFSKAANLGLSDSQFNLAVLYERGMGVPQNLADAYKWYAVAAANGDTESKTRINALATQLSPDDRAAAQRSADMFKPSPPPAAANTPPDISTL